MMKKHSSAVHIVSATAEECFTSCAFAPTLTNNGGKLELRLRQGIRVNWKTSRHSYSDVLPETKL